MVTKIEIVAYLNQPNWFESIRRIYDVMGISPNLDTGGGGNTKIKILICNQTGSKPLTERPTNEQNEKEVSEYECDERPPYREEDNTGK